jgi:hypothetical protein
VSKKDIKYYSIIAAILIATIVFEVMKPKPIDWRFTLEAKDKIPYGTYVLKKTIRDLFPKQKIYTNKKTTFQYKSHLKYKSITRNYIYITNEFKIDKLETKTILNLVHDGNNIIIAAHHFGKLFSDTLNFLVDNTVLFDTSTTMNFYNRNLKRKKDYEYGKSASNIFFKEIDTLKMQVLAYSKNKKPILVRQKIGAAYIYICTTPEIFTNYAMVTEKNYGLTYKILSYLPIEDLVWDEYYKPFRKNNKSLLSVIYKMQGIKVAYIIALITALIFVLFTAKRRQRIIPIIKPYENKTLEFVETIGRVYYNSKNHKDIAEKKHQYFLNFIKRLYNINLSENETINYDRISEKTAVEVDLIKKLLLTYDKINKLEKISAEQLNNFNNYIEDFYDKCK